MGRSEHLERLTSRLAQSGGIVAAGFVAAVVVLYLLSWLTNEVLESETTAIDNATFLFLRQFDSPQLTAVMQVISLMGSEVVLAITTVLLLRFVWQRRWGTALALALVTGGAEVLNNVLKDLFHRTRPTPVAGFVAAQQFSFPSGHAMVSAAFYFYLAYLAWQYVDGRRRVLLVGGLVLLVLLIGLSRLYLEAHYLSDVIAGYLAGFLWTDAVILGQRALISRRRRLAEPS